MKFSRNKSLKKLSTFCIGGKAECFFTSRNISQIISAVKYAEEKHIPWRVMGEGSNVLFPDEKVKGLLIRFYGGSAKKNGSRILASAGISLKDLIDYSLKRGLEGLETLSGIPGTLGGAIAGNAGAYGHSIAERVSRVEIWEDGARKWVPRHRCNFGYRESEFKTRKCVILQAEINLLKGNKKTLFERSRRIIAERTKKYPKGLRCPGSFFKNPLVINMSKVAMKKIDHSKIIDGKIPAGYLLEEVGAKGMHLGHICVADYHGNLFINMGRGTEAQVQKLASILKERVRKRFDIILHEEVRVFEQ